VKATPAHREISVRNNKTSHNPLQVLQKIYANPDVYARWDTNISVYILVNYVVENPGTQKVHLSEDFNFI